MPTRRRLLASGLAAAAGLAVGPPVSVAYGLRRPPDTAHGSHRPEGRFASVEPFTVPFAVPAAAVPTRRDAVADYYDIEMRPGTVGALPGVSTPVWGYAGTWPGPTIHATVGRRVVVRQRNGLPAPVSVHLHGGSTAASSDGHALDLIAPGASKVYRYDNRQPAATLWYHDHAHHHTAEHVYRGLAGCYLLHDPAEEALGLPAGDRDLPLLVQDRTFDEQGALVYEPQDHDGFFGDVVCVNGRPHPAATVRATSYRLRLLNGSNARMYDFAFAEGLELWQVASDGGLLSTPVRLSRLLLSPAERADVVVDFSQAAGEQVHLVDRLATTGEPPIMRFTVAASGPSPAALPPTLAALPAPAHATVRRTVDLSFDGPSGLWVINGKPFEADRLDAVVPLGDTEEWRVRNTSHMAHPLHLHLVQFRVLARDGNLPPAGERGWKDTVRVGPGETVTLSAQFSGHTGTFVYHCHNLEHEDHSMMAQFRVIDFTRHAGSGRVETAAQVSAATFAPGVATAFVATGGAFADALSGGPAAARQGGPVLLTNRDALPAASAAELDRLQPGEIVVLGGQAAVSDSVEQALRRYGSVRRLAGPSRYDTAARIADAFFSPGVPVVYVATGTAFPDALAGGAAAGVRGGPMLLVTRDDVPAATAAALARLRPAAVVALGGTQAISDATLTALRRHAGVEVTRLAGPDRFATAVEVSRATFTPETEVVMVATGTNYPDALAGASAAAFLEAPLLLVGRDRIPEVVTAELVRLAPSRVVVLGGEQAISPAAARELERFVR